MSIQEQFNSYPKEDKAAVLLKLPKGVLLFFAEKRGLPLPKLKGRRKKELIDEVLATNEEFTEEEVNIIIEHISGYSPYFTVYIVLGFELKGDSELVEEANRISIPKDIDLMEKLVSKKEMFLDVQINKDDIPVLIKREQLVVGIKTNYKVNDKRLIVVVANNSKFAYSFAEEHIEGLETIKLKYEDNNIAFKTNPRPPYPPETIFFFNLIKKLKESGTTTIDRIPLVDKVELLNSERYDIRAAIFSGNPFRDSKFWDFIVDRRAAVKGMSFNFIVPVASKKDICLHVNTKFLEYRNLLRVAITNKTKTQNYGALEWRALADILSHITLDIDAGTYNETSGWIKSLSGRDR